MQTPNSSIARLMLEEGRTISIGLTHNHGWVTEHDQKEEIVHGHFRYDAKRKHKIHGLKLE